MACLIPKMADYGGDQRKSKSVQDWKRKQRQSGSEGIKKIKGEDAEQRRAKQRQHMANLRARETGKKRYQQVISIIGSLLSVNNSSSPFITGKRDSRTSDNGPRTDSAVKPMSKGPTVLMIYIFTHFYILDLVHVTHYVLSGQFPTHLVKVIRLIHLIRGEEIQMKTILQLTLLSSKQKPGGYMYLTDLAKAQEYIHHTNDADDDNKEPPQDTEEEDWMLLCCLNHHFTMDTDPPNDGVDWVEHARALPPDILRDCCTWVSSHRKESQDDPSSPWHRQPPPVDITTLNPKQRLAYTISHHHNKNHSQPSTSSTTHAGLWHCWHW